MRKITNAKAIKISIIVGIILFFGSIFIYNLIKLGVFKEDSQINSVLNTTVVFEQPKLSIFDETRYINQFPDTIHVHFPYFLVVVPENTAQITTVYSLTQKKQIAAFNDIVLDYYQGRFLYNYHGGNTYFNGKNLHYHCTLGFIKSDTDILCVTQNASNPLYNELFSINPQTLVSTPLYSPQDAITALYSDKNILYLGEYNYATHQPYITINNKRAKVINYVSSIYPLGNSIYTASFKNDENNLPASYSQIFTSENKIISKLIQKGSIKFY